MRGKSIARALEGLGSDPELMQHLLALEEALTVVLGAPVIECGHCGREEPDFGKGNRNLFDLADRLFTVMVELQGRMQQASRRRSREMRAAAEDERARARSNPGFNPGSRHSKSRDGLEGGSR